VELDKSSGLQGQTGMCVDMCSDSLSRTFAVRLWEPIPGSPEGRNHGTAIPQDKVAQARA